MAPLPDSATARVFYDYVTRANGVEHTICVRVPGVSTAQLDAADARVLAVMQAFGAGNIQVGWKFLRCRFAPQGTEFTMPRVLSTGLASFIGTSNVAYGTDREAFELRFVGRSAATGRRVSFALYGARGSWPVSDYRVDTAEGQEGTVVQSTVNALNASAGAAFLAIDGNSATWYPYVNTGYNRYWQRRIRVGA